jgi:hypothetical protein
MAPMLPKSLSLLSLQGKSERSAIPPTRTVAVKIPVLRFITERLRDAEKTMRGATPFYI